MDLFHELFNVQFNCFASHRNLNDLSVALEPHCHTIPKNPVISAFSKIFGEFEDFYFKV